MSVSVEWPEGVVEGVHLHTCQCQLFDEEVHARLPGTMQEQRHEHCRVAEDNDREQDPEKHELFSLEWIEE